MSSEDGTILIDADVAAFLRDMTATTDPIERRWIGQDHMHRLFEVAFLAAVMRALFRLARSTDHAPGDPQLALNLLLTVGTVSAELLAAEVDNDELDPMWVALDLITAPYGAFMNPDPEGLDDRTMVELVKAVMRRQVWIVDDTRRERLWATFETISQEYAKHAASDADGLGSLMADEAGKLRSSRDTYLLVSWLLVSTRAPSGGQDRRDRPLVIEEDLDVNLFELVPLVGYVEHAYRELGEFESSVRARALGDHLEERLTNRLLKKILPEPDQP